MQNENLDPREQIDQTNTNQPGLGVQSNQYMMSSQPQEPTKSKRKFAVIVVFAVLLIGVGLGAYLLGAKKITTNEANEQSAMVNDSKFYDAKQGFTYTLSGNPNLYFYNYDIQKTQTILQLAENELVTLSDDRKYMLRTRDNVIEVSPAQDNPDFKQVYTAGTSDDSIDAHWLPDGSGFLVIQAVLTNPESKKDNDYWVPRFNHVASVISRDGSSVKQLFQEKASWSWIHVFGVDMKRDEFYYYYNGEGGMGSPLMVRRLSDGAKIRTYGEDLHGETYAHATVADGKAYFERNISDYSKGIKFAKIVELDLDTWKEKTLYQTDQAPIYDNSPNKQASHWLRDVVLSQNRKKIYFTVDTSKDGVNTSKTLVFDFESKKTAEVMNNRKEPNIALGLMLAYADNLFVYESCYDCAKAEESKRGREFYFLEVSTNKKIPVTKVDGRYEFMYIKQIW